MIEEQIFIGSRFSKVRYKQSLMPISVNLAPKRPRVDDSHPCGEAEEDPGAVRIQSKHRPKHIRPHEALQVSHCYVGGDYDRHQGHVLDRAA